LQVQQVFALVVCRNTISKFKVDSVNWRLQ